MRPVPDATISEPADFLVLEAVAGPTMPAVHASPGEPTTIGRSAESRVKLDDRQVSRRHAVIAREGGAWHVADADSRHGTWLNGVRLPPHQPTPLRDGDLLGVEPWTFRVGVASVGARGRRTVDDVAAMGGKVEALASTGVDALAKQRLGLLMECAGRIHGADAEPALASAVLDALVAGTGFARAAVLRDLGGGSEVEVIAHRTPPREDESGFTFSRSLIRAAAAGTPARMAVQESAPIAVSVADLGIRSALCLPLKVGPAVVGYVYLDERGRDGPPAPDAAAFCAAVAEICGLALANLRRRDLESRQAQFETDLKAARAAQALIVPPSQGRLGGLRYAMEMRPGRVVAGDLFDVVDCGGGRVAVFLGDVSGKGVGAAILMATAQTFLHAALVETADPARAVAALNRHVAPRCSDATFITLWAGVFDTGNKTVRFVDAGHGHWTISGQPAPARGPGHGLVIGIDPTAEYQAGGAVVPEGARVLIYSDGLVEQQGADGHQFGTERIAAELAPRATPERDVAALLAALLAHAAGSPFTDDVTIASIDLDAGSA